MILFNHEDTDGETLTLETDSDGLYFTAASADGGTKVSVYISTDGAAKLVAALTPSGPWVTEFGAEYDVPAAILTSGLIDHSWHNDACPSFAPSIDVDETTRILWVEHPDINRRESPDEGQNAHRFTVVANDGEIVVGTDDVEVALQAVRG